MSSREAGSFEFLTLEDPLLVVEGKPKGHQPV